MSAPKTGPWSDYPEDEDLLRENYADMDNETLAELIGRTPSAVYQHALEMGLSKSAEYRRRAKLAKKIAEGDVERVSGPRSRRIVERTPEGNWIGFDGTVLPAWVKGVRRHMISDDEDEG